MLKQNHSSSNTSVTPFLNPLPILFISDVVEADALRKTFRLRSYKDVSDCDLDDDIYIYVTPQTQEIAIKNIIWEFPKARIYRDNLQPYYYNSNSQLIEVTTRIFDYSLSANDWVAEIDNSYLSVRDAKEIAKLAFLKLNGDKQNTEIATLGKRCRMSDYQWGREMIGLEQEFKEELKNRGVIVEDNKQEKLKLEIQALIQETDAFKIVEKRKGLHKQGLSDKNIDFLIDETISSNNRTTAKTISVEDLLKIPTDNIRWIFPGLLPSIGLTILAGAPGALKTTLSYDCAASLMYGEEFLSVKPLKQGKVLFVNSRAEMLVHQMQDSFINRGIFDNCKIITDWDFKQINHLENEIHEYQPTLIIIDSFSGIHDDNFDENSSQAKRSVQKLQALSERYSTSILLIHHTNKSKEQTGVNKIRGNSAIAASCSVIWLMEGDNKSTYKNFSIPKIRGSSNKNMQIICNFDNGRFEVFKTDDDATQDKDTIDYIIAFMKQNPNKKYTVIELVNGTGKTDSAVRKALQRAVEACQITRSICPNNHKVRLYQLPNNPPLPNVSVTEQSLMTESIDNTTISVIGQSLDNVGHSLDKEVESKSCLTSETTFIQASQSLDKLSLDNLDNSGGGSNLEKCTDMSTIDFTPKSDLNYLEIGDNIGTDENEIN